MRMGKIYGIFVLLGVTAFSLMGCSPKRSQSVAVEKTQVDNEMSVVPDTNGIMPIDWTLDELPSAKQLEIASNNYYFSNDYGISSTVNGFGQILSEEDIHVKVVKDMVSGEAMYYSAFYYDCVESDEYGYEAKPQSCIFSLDGELILDWDSCLYQDGIGGWVHRIDYFDDKYDFINPREDNIINDIDSPYRIEEFLYLPKRSAFGYYIMDKDGKMVFDSKDLDRGFGDNSYVNVFENKYVTITEGEEENYNIYFYEVDGSLIGYLLNSFSSDFYSDQVCFPYILCDNVVYDLSQADGGELKPVFMGFTPTYYDSEVAICCAYEGDFKYEFMVDSKTNNIISDEYYFIRTTENYYSKAPYVPKDYFYGVNESGIDMLDKKGKIINHVDKKNIDSIIVDSKWICCNSDEYETITYYDLNLKQQQKDGYKSFVPMYENVGEYIYFSDLWIGSYYIDKNEDRERYDIINADGEVVISGLSYAGNVENNLIAVSLGQYLGNIDKEGNWILKISKSAINNSD